MDSEREQLTPVPTGDARVDAVIQGLASLDDLDLAQRPAVLEAVHTQLRELLGELGEASGPGEPGRRGEQGQLGAGAPQPGAPKPGAPQPGAPRPGAWPQRPNG
jgi:hypothetical protein